MGDAGMIGDVFRRRFVGDVALCGCAWKRTPHGDVLVECPHHRAATRRMVEAVRPRA